MKNYLMVSITKAEREAIAKRFPNAHIVRTMKQKSKRHHYYCEETMNVLKFLEQLRSSEDGAEGDVRYTGEKA